MAAERHMEDTRTLAVRHGSKAVVLEDHAVETGLTLEKPIAEYDSFPHWEVDTDS